MYASTLMLLSQETACDASSNKKYQKCRYSKHCICKERWNGDDSSYVQCDDARGGCGKWWHSKCLAHEYPMRCVRVLRQHAGDCPARSERKREEWAYNNLVKFQDRLCPDMFAAFLCPHCSIR